MEGWEGEEEKETGKEGRTGWERRWLLEYGRGVARKERRGGAPSEVLVFSPVQVVWEPWVVLVCLPRRQR